MKKNLILIIILTAMISVGGCKKDDNPLQNTSNHENYYVNFKTVNFNVVLIHGSDFDHIPGEVHQYDDQPTEQFPLSDRDMEIILSGADFNAITKVHAASLYLYTSYTFSIDLTLFDNEYCIDELIIRIDRYNYEKVIKIYKNFVYVPTETYWGYYGGGTSKGFFTPNGFEGYNGTIPPKEWGEFTLPEDNEFFIRYSYGFKGEYHDQVDFIHQDLNPIYTKQGWNYSNINGQTGHVSTYFKTGKTHELIYPLTIKINEGTNVTQLNSGDFYYIADVRVK